MYNRSLAATKICMKIEVSCGCTVSVAKKRNGYSRKYVEKSGCTGQ
jgi:hypothetical protein